LHLGSIRDQQLSNAEVIMNKSIGLASCAFLLFCGNIFLAGCSVIGYNVGNMIDPAYPAKEIRIPEGESAFPRNTGLVINKKDGTMVKGIFLCMGQVADTVTAEQYENEFEQWRLQREPELSRPIPPFGSSVRIGVSVSRRQEIYAGQFAGFDPGMIRIRSYVQSRIVPLKLEFVDGIEDSLGQVIATREEISQVVHGGVPVASRVEVKPGIFLEGKRGIPIDEIETIQRPAGGGAGRWVGLTVGVAVDVVVAAVAITALVNSIQLDIFHDWGR
jgi:hypothetical protein